MLRADILFLFIKGSFLRVKSYRPLTTNASDKAIKCLFFSPILKRPNIVFTVEATVRILKQCSFNIQTSSQT